MELNEHEREWMAAIRDRRPEYYEENCAVVERCLHLFEYARARHPESCREVAHLETVWLMSLFRRRNLYDRILREWEDFLSRGTSDDAPDEPSPRGTWEDAAYLFTPLLLQELEGSLKRTLQIIGFLAVLETGQEMSWQDYRHNNNSLYQVLTGLSQLPEGDVLRELAAEFRPVDDVAKVTAVRHAIAHADWVVLADADRLMVKFFTDSGEEVDEPLPRLLSRFRSVLEFTLVLYVAIHLGVRRWDEVSGDTPAGMPQPSHLQRNRRGGIRSETRGDGAGE